MALYYACLGTSPNALGAFGNATRTLNLAAPPEAVQCHVSLVQDPSIRDEDLIVNSSQGLHLLPQSNNINVARLLLPPATILAMRQFRDVLMKSEGLGYDVQLHMLLAEISNLLAANRSIDASLGLAVMRLAAILDSWSLFDELCQCMALQQHEWPAGSKASLAALRIARLLVTGDLIGVDVLRAAQIDKVRKVTKQLACMQT